MNKIKLFFQLSVLLLINFSCGGGQQNQLIARKWQISFNIKKHLENMPAFEKKLYDKLSEAQRQEALKEIKLIASKNTFEFKADKSYEMIRGDEKTEKGNWEISRDGKTLTLKNDKGEIEKLGIKQLTNDKLVIAFGTDETVLIPVGTN